LLAELKRHARQSGRPLWFLNVAEQAASLSAALGAADFQRVFFTYDCQVDISRFRSFDDYLQAFTAKDRYAISRDIRRTATAGVQFRWVQDFGPHADDFTRLYEQTYARHQSTNLRLTPDFWIALGESLGPDAEAVVAEHAGQLVGFLLVVKNDAREEMYGYKIGRCYDCGLDRVPFYFSLCIYEPIRRAIELRYRTVWLGPGVYETKTGRGAKPVALYSHFWFPRRRDRWLLLPYLKQYGETARREQQKQFRDPIGATTAAQVPRLTDPSVDGV
jgi:predicted N-acyltransferase